jgi:V8-like Glu-specific endopeptidase
MDCGEESMNGVSVPIRRTVNHAAVAAISMLAFVPGALAQPTVPGFLVITTSNKLSKAMTETFGNASTTDQGTGSASTRQTGREANPCQATSDADPSVAAASATVNDPVVFDATVSLSLTIAVEADGGKTLQQPLSPPCVAESNLHTTATADALASIDVTVAMGPAAEATLYELRLRDPSGSLSEDTEVFYEIFDNAGSLQNFGPNPSSVDPSFVFEGGSGISVRFRLQVSARVHDQGFARRLAGGTLGLAFDIVPAPLLDAALQSGTVRMIGGVKVDEDDYPAVGVVLMRDKVHCSGTLVAPSTVLTAAHCVANRAVGHMKFVLGSSVTEAKIVQEVQSGDFPRGRLSDGNLSYVPATRTADIAVLYLKTPIDRNQFEPALLYDGQRPTFSDFTRADGMTSFVGFGFADETGIVSAGEKRLATMKIRGVTPESFRYGDANHNTCYGDSGGPSFFASDTGNRVTGVVSWGDKQCKSFGVNIRIDRYRSWIVQRLR